jgi:DNA ligase-1
MPLLAEKYEPHINPEGWWMSVKHDGIRAIWDGTKLVSKKGTVFSAPASFLARLPNFKLDGELWLGRGQFDECSSIVASSRDKGWERLRYMLFDIPEPRAGVFEKRLLILKELLKRYPNPYAEVVAHEVCQGREHLAEALQAAIDRGDEGVMLRRAGSLYVEGSSSTLLKVKRMHDAEARVIGYEEGEGSFKGLMGALLCVNDKGIEFKVGTGFSVAERRNPPPLGCQVTFQYQSVTKNGKYRFPSFIRIRPPVE